MARRSLDDPPAIRIETKLGRAELSGSLAINVGVIAALVAWIGWLVLIYFE